MRLGCSGVLLLVLAAGLTAAGRPSRLQGLAESYRMSCEVLSERHGFDRDFWESFSETLVEHETTEGVPYGLLSSTLDFDMIQVCVWLPHEHDSKELGVFLAQFHFQSLALGTVRGFVEGESEKVSLAASNLSRLGVNYGELFRELCGASSGFLLSDAGLRVKVSRVSNGLGSFYVSQLSRDEVCSRLLSSERLLKSKYDLSQIRLVSRFYLTRFLTEEQSGHRMSSEHLRQTYSDLWLYRGQGILQREKRPGLAELSALRLLAYGSWLSRWDELGGGEPARRRLEAGLPSARAELGGFWASIPSLLRGHLARGLRRVGEGAFVSRCESMR